MRAPLNSKMIERGGNEREKRTRQNTNQRHKTHWIARAREHRYGFAIAEIMNWQRIFNSMVVKSEQANEICSKRMLNVNYIVIADRIEWEMSINLAMDMDNDAGSIWLSAWIAAHLPCFLLRKQSYTSPLQSIVHILTDHYTFIMRVCVIIMILFM